MLVYLQKFETYSYSLFCSLLAYAVLSDKKKRRLYDSVGHEAFLENHASLEDEEETNFHFSFSDFFHGFHDSPFMDEPHIHWSFLQEEEEEDIQYKHYSFEDSTFSFYFDDENEDGHYYWFQVSFTLCFKISSLIYNKVFQTIFVLYSLCRDSSLLKHL